MMYEEGLPVRKGLPYGFVNLLLVMIGTEFTR